MTPLRSGMSGVVVYATLFLTLLKVTTVDAGGRQAAPVPPTQELEILDPRVDPEGLPAVLLQPTADLAGQEIQIPPSVIVHRYYYTGDRDFQGPLLKGGPSIVVFNHPKTGEQMYVHAQLPPGAPRVRYDSRSIEYDYGPQSVKIAFCLFHHQPKVIYSQGYSGFEKLGKTASATGKVAGTLVSRTYIPDAINMAASTTARVTVNTIDVTSEAVRAAATPVVKLVEFVPLVKPIQSKVSTRAERVRDLKLRRAGRTVDLDIPTVR